MVSLNSPKKTRKAVKVEEEAPEDGEEDEVVMLFARNKAVFVCSPECG